MTLRHCSICFVKPVFFAGETVSGKVNLRLEKNKSCTALMLDIEGEAQCRWKDVFTTDKRKRVGKKHKIVRSFETYFQISNNLTEVSTSDLVAGNHTFDFTFVLPQNLPSSLEGYYGYVRYTATVVLKRQYKFDLRHKILFTVLSHIDLNLIPEISCPIQKDQSKQFYFLFFKKGNLYMTVKIPFSGYVSGQSIPVTCHLKNDSNVKVECVKALLTKNVSFSARGHFKYETLDISQCSSGETICEEEKTYCVPCYVPPTPTNSKFCSLIDVTYVLKVIVVVSGMHTNLSCTIPITIGTVPLIPRSNILVEDNRPSASTSGTPSVPPAYSDMAPPSYEEAVILQRMEEEFEEWDHTKEFSPKYPVYNFDKK